MQRSYLSLFFISVLMTTMNITQCRSNSILYAEESSDTLVEEVIIPIENITTSEEGEEVYFIVEEMPKFNGGGKEEFRKYIAQNLIYPPKAAENGISGRVFVQFAINKKGKVVDIVVVRGVDPLLDKEAVRVIRQSPDWTPGYQKGKPVKVQYTFPIVFVLNRPDLPEKD